MNMMDYRLTKYEEQKLQFIKQKKGKLLREIRIKHPRTKDFYTLVRKNYKKEFMNAYDNKCVYCGISLDLIPKKMFEIDHVIYKKSPRFNNCYKRNKNGMSNLVLSCYDCNRKKTDFSIERDIEYILHGDYNKIKEVFHRDAENYTIIIGNIDKLSPTQQKTIRDFYNLLMLGNYIHRLDYLLMSMYNLSTYLSSNGKSSSSEHCTLLKCINVLQKKRNGY